MGQWSFRFWFLEFHVFLFSFFFFFVSISKIWVKIYQIYLYFWTSFDLAKKFTGLLKNRYIHIKYVSQNFNIFFFIFLPFFSEKINSIYLKRVQCENYHHIIIVLICSNTHFWFCFCLLSLVLNFRSFDRLCFQRRFSSSK